MANKQCEALLTALNQATAALAVIANNRQGGADETIRDFARQCFHEGRRASELAEQRPFHSQYRND